jgi:TRAP-type C4-dicarboxylate transport system permease small subunit
MILKGLQRGFEKLTQFLAAFAALLILGMSLWITYDVIARSWFGIGSPWSFDLSEYSLVWITFLGAPWVLLQDRHVRIELLVDVMPVNVQRVVGIVVSLIACAACAVLTWRSGIAAVGYFENNIMMPRIWRIPRVWPYAAVPVGSALLMLTFAVRASLYFTESDPEAVLRDRATADQPDPVSDEGESAQAGGQ